MGVAKILSTFRLIASEFNDVDDEKVNSMIELQGVRVSQKAFGDKYDLAIAYLTAHAFKLDEMLKGGGASSGGLISGTITSIGLTVPTGMVVSGSPLTKNGTIGITYGEGYSLPLTAKTYRDWETDRKSTRLNSSHSAKSRMPSSA